MELQAPGLGLVPGWAVAGIWEENWKIALFLSFPFLLLCHPTLKSVVIEIKKTKSQLFCFANTLKAVLLLVIKEEVKKRGRRKNRKTDVFLTNYDLRR